MILNILHILRCTNSSLESEFKMLDVFWFLISESERASIP